MISIIEVVYFLIGLFLPNVMHANSYAFFRMELNFKPYYKQ